MAEIAGTHTQQMPMNGSDQVVKEKWVKHYSSNHQILLVGEGDFSFSLSLAMSFGTASNIVASDLNSYGDLISKYKNAKANLDILGAFGAQLLYQVNAIKTKNHADLRMRKFDRIVYNFPHIGILWDESNEYIIMEHQNWVQSFLWNARCMLSPKGEIHVTHRTEHPYNLWNIGELARKCGLTLAECVEFKIEDYPGYNNKRGDGSNADKTFPIGNCSTFKFMVSSNAMKSFAEFPYQTELKNKIANLKPYVDYRVDALIYEANCLTPDLYDFPYGLEPSSSGVGIMWIKNLVEFVLDQQWRV